MSSRKKPGSRGKRSPATRSPDRAGAGGAYPKIYAVVRRIPRGRVATYGQIARLAGLPGRARQVGYAMHALGAGTRLPWQRVVNAQGKVSRRRVPGGELTQRLLLLREGIRFDARGRISFERFGWRIRGEVGRWVGG